MVLRHCIPHREGGMEARQIKIGVGINGDKIVPERRCRPAAAVADFDKLRAR